MADTFKRLSNLIKGTASEWMNRVEADNPEAIAQAAVEGARSRYDQVMSHLGRLKREDNGAVGERDRVEKELAQLRSQRAAVDNESDLALRLDEAIGRMDARLETLEAEATARDELTQELQARAVELRQGAQSLKGEKDSLLARSIIAKETTSAQSLAAGAPTRAYERALQSVRDSADQVRRTAETGLPSDAELAKLKAEARLAALKAMRNKDASAAAAPTQAEAPAQGDATAQGSEGTDKSASPSPLPDRDL